MITCKRPGCDRTLKKMAIEGYCSGCCRDIHSYQQDAQALYTDNLKLRELAWDTLCAEEMPKLNHTYTEPTRAPITPETP